MYRVVKCIPRYIRVKSLVKSNATSMTVDGEEKWLRKGVLLYSPATGEIVRITSRSSKGTVNICKSKRRRIRPLTDMIILGETYIETYEVPGRYKSFCRH